LFLISFIVIIKLEINKKRGKFQEEEKRDYIEKGGGNGILGYEIEPQIIVV